MNTYRAISHNVSSLPSQPNSESYFMTTSWNPVSYTYPTPNTHPYVQRGSWYTHGYIGNTPYLSYNPFSRNMLLTSPHRTERLSYVWPY